MELKLKMEGVISISSCAVVLCIVYNCTQFVVQYWNNRRKRLRSLPPGPFPLPVLGNLLNLGKKPHQSLAEIAKRYGPLVSLRLGCLTTVVVSSSSVARELFQRNDAVSAERTVGHTTTVLGHHLDSVVFLPPGPKWRNLRRICNSHIFASSAARLGAGQDLQKEKVEQLISHLNNIISSSNCEVAVNISQVMFTTSLNILSNTMFSIDMASLSSSSSAHELKELVRDMLEVGGIPNVSDFFPLLRWIDPQRLHRRASALVDRMIKMFDQIIEQRMRKRQLNCNCNEEEIEEDVLDTLLNINHQRINKDGDGTGIVDIPHLMFDLFVAGTDTTSSTIEWAMTELLRNPTKMVKAQAELDQVIGRNPNINPVKETHIPDLPYLQAVIKETLRLHPPAPFLIPRKASQDMELCGFTIPKGTQILVNAWAMGRDETVWHNATGFEPERFIKISSSSSIDFFRDRNNYDLIPFGCGRRLCLGMPLALKILPLALGSLLHSFDWKLPDGMEPHQIDVDDKFGITLQKATSLEIIPLPRHTTSN